MQKNKDMFLELKRQISYLSSSSEESKGDILTLAKSLSKLSQTSASYDPMITMPERLSRNKHLIDKLNKLRELLSIAEQNHPDEVAEM